MRSRHVDCAIEVAIAIATAIVDDHIAMVVDERIGRGAELHVRLGVDVWIKLVWIENQRMPGLRGK